MKVAIPTNDGKTVADHFGRARCFWIAEVDKGVVLSEQLLENSDIDHGHGDHRGLLEILKGVDIVVCANLGMRIYSDLVSSGIPIYMTGSGEIGQSIQDILQGNLRKIEETSLCGGKHHETDRH